MWSDLQGDVVCALYCVLGCALSCSRLDGGCRLVGLAWYLAGRVHEVPTQ